MQARLREELGEGSTSAKLLCKTCHRSLQRSLATRRRLTLEEALIALGKRDRAVTVPHIHSLRWICIYRK